MPSTWPVIEPANLGIEGQRYTNSPTSDKSLEMATGLAQSAVDLELHSDMGSIPAWTDYLVVLFSRLLPTIRRISGSTAESYPAFALNGLRQNPGGSLNQVETPHCSNIKQREYGASSYWSLDVRNSLTETFPDHWIERGGRIWWPPRSPDITPLDFFLWGYVKDHVFPLQDIPVLRTRICDTIL
ncbi:hypothetical protein ANN_04405 [Periplaneta americana]|uniref:Uncharacterized protein n=1 Tax=Periplaneta americana TaxID=6978 RepID=A0ABQ8T8G4_PERAM|nr:hypothetical protein ANN_04405 [Periplaneta americana]